MRRGEIWLVSLDPTAGHEQRGTRPVLIVSPARFNALTRTPVVLPFTVPLHDAGTRTVGVIRCDQPRTLDLAARNGRHLESVPEEVMHEVLARLTAILA